MLLLQNSSRFNCPFIFALQLLEKNVAMVHGVTLQGF